MVGVLFKPPYPENLNLLPPIAYNLLWALIMDGDSEDVNESAILIGMRVVIFRRGNHDIRSCAKVDDI